MWELKKRIRYLVDQLPARRELKAWRNAYWEAWDELHNERLNYQRLHESHQTLLQEVRYWESRHAKVLSYIERQMDRPEVGVQ